MEKLREQEIEEQKIEKQERKEILEVRDLHRSYFWGENEQTEVLKGLDFTIYEGEYVGIIGKSGCGKTTLLKVLGLIDLPTGGDILFKGRNSRDLWKDELSDIRRREIGFVFQDFYLMDSLTVEENIMLPMILDKADPDKASSIVEKLAGQFGLSHLLKKNPYELSGGEKQRVAICRALCNDPGVILADEPTGNLDAKSGDIVNKAMEDINRDMNKTIILVTHNPEMASYCSRILMLKDGAVKKELRKEGSREEFYRRIMDEISAGNL